MLEYHEPHESRLGLCTEGRSCIDDCPALFNIRAELKERVAITGSKG